MGYEHEALPPGIQQGGREAWMRDKSGQLARAYSA